MLRYFILASLVFVSCKPRNYNDQNGAAVESVKATFNGDASGVCEMVPLSQGFRVEAEFWFSGNPQKNVRATNWSDVRSALKKIVEKRVSDFKVLQGLNTLANEKITYDESLLKDEKSLAAFQNMIASPSKFEMTADSKLNNFKIKKIISSDIENPKIERMIELLCGDAQANGTKI